MSRGVSQPEGSSSDLCSRQISAQLSTHFGCHSQPALLKHQRREYVCFGSEKLWAGAMLAVLKTHLHNWQRAFLLIFQVISQPYECLCLELLIHHLNSRNSCKAYQKTPFFSHTPLQPSSLCSTRSPSVHEVRELEIQSVCLWKNNKLQASGDTFFSQMTIFIVLSCKSIH